MNGLPKLAIIAGGGKAPRSIVEACRTQGRDFFVVCLEGQADKDFGTDDLPHIWLPLGAGARLKEILLSEKIVEVIMIGQVRRPSVWELKPDWLAVKVVARIGMHMLGDDGLLRALGHVIEQECPVRIVGVKDILGGLLMRQGALGASVPDAEATQDIERGVAVARALGSLDVGQSVIVQQGLVLGVEAIEGTDALIARSAEVRRQGRGGVLVKLAKPQQDDRYDLPAIGPQTVIAATKAGLKGIALEAHRALIIDRDQVKKLADEADIFVIGI